MENVIELQVGQVAIAYIFVLILLVIIKVKNLNREKELIVSSLRMTIQLVITGYVLIYVFDNSSYIYTIGIIILMECFAIYNIFKQVNLELSNNLKRIIAFSIVVGTLIPLVFFSALVIKVSPWYDPRYIIPITGMIIGNSMTGVSLGVVRLVSDMNSKRGLIETALMLGATPKVASREIVDNAFDSAILPTINSMVGIGIVFLPGMMTGQILSGTSPITAIEYQIVIMLAILGGVSLTTILLVQLGYKTFFNSESQLIYNSPGEL